MSKQIVSTSRGIGDVRHRLRIVVAVVVAMFGLTAGATGVATNGQPESITIVAMFDDASPLLVGNDVKVHGVQVGQVAALNVRGRKNAAVAMTLRPEALPVHQDAKATIKPVSLLGERFIDLQRGSASAPALGNGDVIKRKQTGATTNLDQVLNTLDDPTGKSLSALVTVLGEGMRGNGGNADAAIRALAPAMRDTDGLVRILRKQNGLLNGLVDKLQPVAKSLAADNGSSLDGLVSSAHKLTAATAAQRRELSRTLDKLPGTLQAARSTLGQLAGTANSAVPTLKSIRPVTGNLREISREVAKFADAADPALASAKPVLNRAQQLLDRARPVVDELRKAGPKVPSVAANANRVVTKLTDNLDNVLNFVRYWALTTNGKDGLSHYFRAMVMVNTDTLTGLIPGLNAPNGAESGGDAKKQGSGNNDDASSGAVPKLPGVTGEGGLLSPPEETEGSGATGLTKQQEGGMLDFLIGGGK